MNKVMVQYPETGDVVYVAENLRKSDLNELKAARGADVDPVDVLLQAVELSGDLCWVALAEDTLNPIAVFGAAPVDEAGGLGSPWLLGTEEVYRHKALFLVEMKKYLDLGHDTFPRYINRVHADNRQTIGWLKHLGFEVGEPVAHGPLGQPFCFFHKEVSHV